MQTQAQYHARELTAAHNHYQEINNAPVNDRKEAYATLLETCQTDPALIAERIGWLFNGSYGYGEMHLAINATRARNPKPELFALIATFEWQAGHYFARKAYLALTKAQKDALNNAIDKEIADWRAEQAAEQAA